MPFDPSAFHLYNVADTCSIWNVLSSFSFYRSVRTSGVRFICTAYVAYECLSKPRQALSSDEIELRNRLQTAQESNGDFSVYQLDVDDLQSIELLEKRKRVGKGELSSIAFALKTRQAFMTDDDKAYKLGVQVLPSDRCQTTPHLLGWLVYTNAISDGDVSTIITEQGRFSRDLSKRLNLAHAEACRCRLMGIAKSS